LRLPFVLGREIETYEGILIFDEGFYRDYGKLDLMLNTRVVGIDRESKMVICERCSVGYDKLVISTGSYAFVPPIPGIEGIGLGKRTFTYKFMPEAEALDRAISDANKVVVIGAGLVGIEVADALRRRGLDVTIVELLPTVIHMMLDEDMARLVTDELENMGIKLMLGTKVEGIEETEGSVIVSIPGERLEVDACVIASGVRAETSLAKKAGLDVGMGIIVDDHMHTSDPDIYSCGDCIETTNAVTGRRTLDQLGSSAVRQARVVAANLAGGDIAIRPTLSTSITHIGSLGVAAVGITSNSARDSGFDVLTARFKGSTLPEYYPGGREITIKLVFTPEKKLLGAQIIGTDGVLARIDTISAIMQLGGGLDELNYLETAYTPPLSPTIDPICLAAGAALKKCERARRG